MKYILRCKKCNDEYPIDYETFNRLVPIDTKFKITLRDNKDVIGAIVEFDEECPKCKLTKGGKTSGRSRGRVILIREADKAGISEN